MRSRQSEKAAAGGKIEVIAAGIVKLRYVFFVLFAVITVCCFFSIGRTRTSNDLTAFLPSDSETKQVLKIMDDEFETISNCRVMLTEITYEDAKEISAKISKLNHVISVGFDDTHSHYKDNYAMFSISFDRPGNDKEVQNTVVKIKEAAKPYKCSITGDVNDYSKQLSKEMRIVILVAGIVIFAVLLFTSYSYFEAVIFALVFAVAGIINMGTNYWLGTISSITNSIAVILQLALAIDYSIILMHRYAQESSSVTDKKTALIRALSKSIVEISSSSLTTIAGLIALTLMKFRLGYDLGFVLIKGIVCSMLTVFLLMPGFILLFSKAIEKTRHKKMVPEIKGWGGFLAKRVPVFLLVFVLILPFAVVMSNKTDFAFSTNTVSEIIPSESRTALHMVDDTFEPNTSIAVLVPVGNYEKEKIILDKVNRLEKIKSATGLANIEITEGKYLTDKYNPEQFAKFLGIDIESSKLLFKSYSLEHLRLDQFFKIENSDIPLIDLLTHLLEIIDSGKVNLSESQSAVLSEQRDQIEKAVNQLRGYKWDRLIFTANVPAEGSESTGLVKMIRSIAEDQYGKGRILITGQITSSSDLRSSFKSDSLMINVLSVLFVFIILLFTFKSPVIAGMLVFIIQGSIWINFSFSSILGDKPSFVTYMIVSAIQMGATVDYAIVLTSRYKQLRQKSEKREALSFAIGECFPTVLTSGLIMTVAGLLIAFMVSDVYVGHIGLAVGRGAAISVILVLTVLPQMLLLFDKTLFKVKSK